MRRSLAVCIALLALTTTTQAQGTPPADAPTPASATTASLAGDVYLKQRSGDRQAMADRPIRLVPLAAFQAQAPQCAARDSSRAAYLRLRREARLAYGEANTTNERRRNGHLERADAARAAAFAALEPAMAAENEIVAWLNAQPAARTDANGAYAFDAIAPGGYVLYVDAFPTHEWFDPVTVRPGSQRHDLTEASASEVASNATSFVATAACGHVATHPRADGQDDGAEPARIERLPALANRADVQRLVARRYPHVLRGVGGHVVVRARVLPDGTVEAESVEALESSLDGFRSQGELEGAAELVVEGMRFEPAMVGGEAVPMWVSVPIVFSAYVVE